MNTTAAVLVTFGLFLFCVAMYFVALHFGFIGIIAYLTLPTLIGLCFSEGTDAVE